MSFKYCTRHSTVYSCGHHKSDEIEHHCLTRGASLSPKEPEGFDTDTPSGRISRMTSDGKLVSCNGLGYRMVKVCYPELCRSCREMASESRIVYACGHASEELLHECIVLRASISYSSEAGADSEGTSSAASATFNVPARCEHCQKRELRDQANMVGWRDVVDSGHKNVRL